jgi:hypothetical protein
VLLKAPAGAAIAEVVASALSETGSTAGVSVAPDVDPMDLL